MKFIELTNQYGDKFILNTNFIYKAYQLINVNEGYYTCIQVQSANASYLYHVKESYDLVKTMLLENT